MRLEKWIPMVNTYPDGYGVVKMPPGTIIKV